MVIIHFGQTIKFKNLYILITFHIHHLMWMLLQGKHFPLHWKKPCQLDWRKLVLEESNLFCS